MPTASGGQEVFGEYHRPFRGPEEEYGGQARVSGDPRFGLAEGF